MSTRHYLSLPQPPGNESGEKPKKTSWQIHYRESGLGMPVVILHPSPLSSAFMEPIIDIFSEHYRAIAWDTPGYGQSDALPAPGDNLAPYVEALHQFIQGLGLDRPLIYGSATGAQIAIEYGKAYPRHTRGLLLENAAWFYDDEREAMLESYFPDLSPREDGSHLTAIWTMVTQLYRYFPWYDTSEKSRVNAKSVPLDVLQNTLMDYLRAGPDYSRAYRAAFENENPGQMSDLQVPTHLLRWEGSMLKQYIDRLDCAELPDCISMCFAGDGIEARYSALKNSLNVLMSE